MKLKRWFVVLASTVTLAACSDGVAPVEPNRLTARWAGETWVGGASAGILRGGAAGDTLYLWAEGPIGTTPFCLCPTTAPKENHIVVKVLFTGPGVYLLGPGAAKFEEWVGGDVINAAYATSPEATGMLIVSDYTGIGGRVEGSLAFDAVSSNVYKSFGPRASLEGGRFRAAVQLVRTN